MMGPRYVVIDSTSSDTFEVQNKGTKVRTEGVSIVCSRSKEILNFQIEISFNRSVVF